MPASNTWKRQKNPVPKKRSQKSLRRWLLIWLSLTGVAMVSATAGALLAVSLSATPLKQVELSPEDEAVFSQDEAIASQSLQLPELTRPVTIMILGTKVLTSDLDTPPEIDLGYHALVNSFEGLSDTMLLVRFDPQDKALSVLSIPRDTRTRIEGHGITKLNAANYHGGPALAARSISNLLNEVPIDRYIRVNVQGIEKLIDALGGVTVYVPQDMKYTDHSQHLYIDLKEGKQHLDGDKAMQFLRFRYDQYGDIGRVQRQQILMRALTEQVLKPSVIVKVPQILKVIQSHIDTNLSVQELVALMGFASQTERSQIKMLMVPGEFNGTGREEVSYWIPHRRRISEMMAQHFDQGFRDETLNDPAYLRIAIQDSTDNPEAVQGFIKTLREVGYRNVYHDKDWSEPLRKTRILAQNGDDASASAVRADLEFGEVQVGSQGVLSSDITIQLGTDWLPRWQLQLIENEPD